MQLVMVNPISLVKVCPIKNLHSTDSVSLSYILISLVIPTSKVPTALG